MDFSIPGNAAGIRSRTRTMRDEGQTYTATGDALARLTTDGWTGRAADRFREKFDAEPERWRTAGDGFRMAAAALETYADALEGAQARADWARDEHERGDTVTAQARAMYDADVSRARAEVAAATGRGELVTLTILPFHDPGDAVREAAVAELHAARADLEMAAGLCADRVRAGCAAAPEERRWWETGLAAVGSFLSGAGEAVTGFLTMPLSPLSLLGDSVDVLTGRLTSEEFDAKYRLGMEQVGIMLSALREDPAGFGLSLGKALLDWDTWADDPARALGRLVPDAIAGLATGGAAAFAMRGARGGADALDALSDVSRVADDVADLSRVGRLDGPHGVRDPLHAYDDLADFPVHDRGTDAWADAVVGRHPELSRDGVLGLHDYTTQDGYSVMNGFSRNPASYPQELHPEIQARIDRASQGIAELPPYEGVVFRGTNVPTSVLDDLASTGQYRDPAFSSASLEPHVGREFLQHRPPKPDEEPVLFTLTSRSGVNVQAFSEYPGEAEILFDRATGFRLVSRQWNAEDRYWEIFLEERP